jgi:cyclomaltodextrinase / maltogenic alpha-amylase / neopullulanase
VSARTSLLAAALLLAAAPAWAAAPVCREDPLDGRSAYLRGSFNAWAAADAQRFTWACNRWELVTALKGEHRFKIADEGWSADVDFGSADGRRLVPRGPEIQRRFDGTYRFTVTMADANTPELKIESCPAGEPPLGKTTLFLRGTPNNWAALDDYAFTYSCDAYYLNLRLEGLHEFKIADAAWADATTINPAGIGQRAGGNFSHRFSGEHTLRLAWAGGRPQLDIGPRSWADPRAAVVTDPVALSLRFDSRSAMHKKPFGAVAAGSEIEFVLEARPGVTEAVMVVERRRLEGNQEVLEYTEAARVPMQRQSGPDGTERFVARHRFADIGVYGYWFDVRVGERRFAYQNNTTPLHWTREKGTGGLGAVGERPAHLGGIRRFRQTVHDPKLAVPDWAADIVYYYVFPERFRNGNKANDPQPGVTRYRNKGVERHARWTDRPYKPGTGDGSDEVFNNDFFGGDLDGLIDKLDDIKALGANTIYMTPVFRAPSNHKYDHADYLNIDPGFGDNATFERLTREAARRGIRVIPDASLNHTGSDSIYFDRYGNFAKNGVSQGAFANGKPNPASPYFNWYRFDLTQANPDQQYRGWVGVTDLPELDKTSPAWREFAYRAPDSVTRTWLRRGASGWRMDVAPWVPDDFWREWRRAVKETRPDALTVAETWFDSSKYFLGDMFDSTMNYVFRNAVQAYAAGGKAADLVAQLEHLREAYPAPVHQALMNLLSSHDQARALHVFGWDDAAGRKADANTIARAKQRLLLAVTLQMSYPGAPTVYYGDEVGVTGGDDPYNRATYPWPDEGGQPDLALRAQFQRLIAMRHAHPVLRHGTVEAPVVDGEHVVVWLRRMGPPGQERFAVVALNNAEQPRRVRIARPAALPPGPLRDALSGAGVEVGAEWLEFELPALSGRVLLR